MEQYSTAAATSTEQSLFELQVDHEVSSHLTQTAKWTKFLSIMGFIGIGFMVIAVIFMGTMLSRLSPLAGAGVVSSGAGFMQVVLLLGIMALYFYPCLCLFNFSNKMLRAIKDNDQYSLVGSFRQLKMCFKFMGILTIVLISLYVLALFFALIFAATR